MTIDQTYTVDTLLAEVDVEALMTRAFELTHKIHGLDKAAGRAVGEQSHQHGARGGALRLERDAIVREMQRRSDGMERALVVVEASERLMRGVDEALGHVHHRDPRAVAKAVCEAREVLDDAMERTTTLTCSLVKNQTISDRIAEGARAIVLPIVKRARASAARVTL